MKKKLTEKDTRKKLLDHAKRIGAEEDLKNLFNKWDRAIALVRSCAHRTGQRLLPRQWRRPRSRS